MVYYDASNTKYWTDYVYNENNELISETYNYNKNKKKVISTETTYTYDVDGNLITKDADGDIWQYLWTSESRLEAVVEGGTLLMAATYDGDNNRVFQISDASSSSKVHQDSSLKSEWKSENGNSYPWENGNGNGGNGTGHSNTGNGGTTNGGGHNHTGNNSDGLKHANCKQCVDTQEAFVQSLADDAVSIDGTDYLPVGKPNSYKDYELIYYINDVTIDNEEVLVEYGAAGTATGTYEYGLQRLSVEYVNEAKEYYLYNGTGNVTQTTAENGSMFLRYTYDAFGNISSIRAPMTVDIDDLNRYTYNGEDYDYNTGLQYLRARYYSTGTGNFISQDTYLGDLLNPLSQNRYTYAHNSPVMFDDPSGHYIDIDGIYIPGRDREVIEKQNDEEIRNRMKYVYKNLYNTYIPDTTALNAYTDFVFRQAAGGNPAIEDACRDAYANTSLHIKTCVVASRNGWTYYDTKAAMLLGKPLSLEEMFPNINEQEQDYVTVKITENTIDITIYVDFHGEENLVIGDSGQTYKELVIAGFTEWGGTYYGDNDDNVFGFNSEVTVNVIEDNDGMDVYLKEGSGRSRVILYSFWDVLEANWDWATTSDRSMRLYTETFGDNPRVREHEEISATAAHEIGHVFGIGDAYADDVWTEGSDLRPAASKDDTGKYGIMRDCWNGTNIDDKEIQMLLYAFNENEFQSYTTYGKYTRSEALDK